MDKLLKLIEEERHTGAESYLEHLQEYMDRALRDGNLEAQQYANSLMGEHYYVVSDMDSCRHYLMESTRLSLTTHNPKALVVAYNILGIDALNNGNYMQAMDDFEQILRDTDDDRAIAVSEGNIANIYEVVGDFEKAMEHALRADAYFSTGDDPKNYLNNLLTTCQLGEYSLRLGKVEEAAEFLEKVKELEKIYPDYVTCDPIIPELHAHYYAAIGREDETRKYMEQYIRLAADSSLIVDLFNDVVNMGEFMMKYGEMDLVPQVLDLLKDTAVKSGNIAYEESYLRIYIHYCEKTGDKEELLNCTARYFEVSEARKVEDLKSVRANIEFRETMEELRRENKQLMQEVHTDSLTHIANRKALNDHLEQAFERAWKNQTSLAVEILDVDYFKQLNDTYGHQKGDECLQAIAHCLKNVRNEDIFVARYGGDEFCIVYEGFTDEQVLEVARRLRRMVQDLDMEHKASPVGGKVTVSQGIRNSVPDEMNRVWDFLYAADNALYEVKRTQKGEIVLMHNAFISEKSLADTTRE